MPRATGRLRSAGAALAILGLACSTQTTAPAPMRGRWVSADARFAGRVLEIGTHLVRFVDADRELDAIVIRDVEVESAGTVQRIVIEGSARDGSPVELALELRSTPEQLRFATQDSVWRREGALARGAAQ